MSLVLLQGPPGSTVGTFPEPITPASTRRRRSRDEPELVVQNRTRASRIIGHAILIGLGLFAVFPVAWMYLSSLRPPDQVLSAGLTSTHFSLANYSVAID